jgi:malonyl-CoA/methylmalonyl-CoA synthetase
MTSGTLPEQLQTALLKQPEHATRMAVVSAHGENGKGERALTYGQLDRQARHWAAGLLESGQVKAGDRVALLLPPGTPWLLGLRAVWYAGAAAVPLCLSHPLPEWQHVLEDAQCSLLLADPGFLPRLEPLQTRMPGLIYPMEALLRSLEQDRGQVAPAGEGSMPPLPLLREARTPFARNRPDDIAQLVYTSGSTGKPKGAVVTHGQLAAQIQTLVKAWDWSEQDRIVNVLPLHHVHGMVNVYACALWCGASIVELGRFDAKKTWQALSEEQPTLFMAVPTVYQKLLQAYQAADTATQARWTAACQRLRLMVSGSAALSPHLLEEWRAISGHTLLERYGMTEIGMALSNPLQGARVAGTVGFPLPGVECRIAEDAGAAASLTAQGATQAASLREATGELLVRSASVFQGYWNKPDQTAAAFDGPWFRTGDLVHRDAEGRYRILGRLSVDIIKTGGFKVAAPEIEQTLLAHPAIAECAVVGVPDATWGEQVGAVLVLRTGHSLTLEELRRWARERLAVYKVPGRLVLTETLPRNAMGKVVKPALPQLFQDSA